MRLTAFPALFFLASSVVAQSTWTVSPSDPGADFVDIQSAVDGASNGDTILIKSGFYSSFEIDGKSLYLLGDDSATVLVAGSVADGALVRIKNLPANSQVTMRGLELISPQAFDIVVGIHLLDNAGEVWLENVDVQMFHPFTLVVDKLHAVRAINSSTVVIIDSVLFGHRSSEGLSIDNSNVFVYGSTVKGGAGGADQLTPNLPFDGGHGAAIMGGQLFAADSSFLAGPGVNAAFFVCTPATNGGDGVHVAGGVFRDRSNTSTGGAGGTADFCPGPDGSDGGGIVLAGGTREAYSEVQRQVTANSPVREGELSTQVYSGVPSELVFTTIGFSLDSGLFFPDFAGPLLLGNPKLYRFCGLLDGAGTRTKSFTLQELGFDSVTAYFHPSFLDLGTLIWRSGTPSAVTYMDSGL